MRVRTISMILAAAVVCALVGALALRESHPKAAAKVFPQKKEGPLLSPGVKEVVSLTQAEARPKQIAEHVHGLGKQLGQPDQEALCNWILQRKPAHVSAGAWEWLVNEAMDKLCQQEKPSPKLTGTLIAIYRDAVAGDVLRDYAIQHLAHYLQPASIWEPCERDPLRRKDITDLLLQAAARADTSIAGTALQGMHLALQARDHISATSNSTVELPVDTLKQEQIEEAALRLIRAKDRNPLATITALQVCVQRQVKAALVDARQIAADRTEKTALRVAAISALGQMGEPDDMSALAPLQGDEDLRISSACRAAQQRLRGGPST